MASPQASSTGKDPDTKDVLIAVMGPTGSGKTSLINLATQLEPQLAVSGDEDSCTSTVESAPPFELDGRRVILYDTPGFDDSHMSDTDVLKIIVKELETQYRKGTTLHGIIYVHAIDQPRISGKTRANFTLMQKICGAESLKNVVLVTNRWGRLTDAEKFAKMAKLLSPGTFLASAVEKKAQVAHNTENTVDSVRDIISRIIRNIPLPLLVQKELVTDNKPFSETSAGKESDKRLVEMEEKLKRQMAEQLDELKEAQRERDLVMAKEKREEVERHQKEIERINNERKNLDSSYAALLSRVEGELRALRVAAARAPAPAPAPAPGPSRSTATRPQAATRPATAQSIISGKQYTIRSVVHDRYVTCEEDGFTVTGRGNRNGFGRRWIFTRTSSGPGNYIIKSVRYGRYLSSNNSSEVRVLNRAEEWQIKFIPDSYREFRLYNPKYFPEMLLALKGNAYGTPVLLENREGYRDEIWDIEEI